MLILARMIKPELRTLVMISGIPPLLMAQMGIYPNIACKTYFVF